MCTVGSSYRRGSQGIFSEEELWDLFTLEPHLGPCAVRRIERRRNVEVLIYVMDMIFSGLIMVIA